MELYTVSVQGKRRGVDDGRDLIFLGLNPSKLKVSVGRNTAHIRFTEWLDVLGLKSAHFANLSPDPEWDMKFKTFDHDDVKTGLAEYNKIVTWGDKVSNYIKRLGISNHCVIPHPSGLNRKINDHKYVMHTLEKCKEYIYENNYSIR